MTRSKLKMPPPPPLREKQRTAGRFYETSEMMDHLSVYYGTRNPIYPRSWQYRTIIAAHREQGASNTYRKPYGADWKGRRRFIDKNGFLRWTNEGCISIKRDVLEYTSSGKLPLVALQRGSELIRAEEMHALRAIGAISRRVASLLK